MGFNTYKFSKQNLEIIERTDNLTNHILEKIESNLIKEYLLEQKRNFGVNKIGGRIRKNKELIEIFKNNSNNYFVKMTENQRSFMKVFIDSVIKCENNRIDFVVLGKNFGSQSKLVDSSFITINNVNKILVEFFDNFNFLKEIDIYFHELVKFDGYYLEVNEKYSKIIKK